MSLLQLVLIVALSFTYHCKCYEELSLVKKIQLIDPYDAIDMSFLGTNLYIVFRNGTIANFTADLDQSRMTVKEFDFLSGISDMKRSILTSVVLKMPSNLPFIASRYVIEGPTSKTFHTRVWDINTRSIILDHRPDLSSMSTEKMATDSSGRLYVVNPERKMIQVIDLGDESDEHLITDIEFPMPENVSIVNLDTTMTNIDGIKEFIYIVFVDGTIFEVNTMNLTVKRLQTSGCIPTNQNETYAFSLLEIYRNKVYVPMADARSVYIFEANGSCNEGIKIPTKTFVNFMEILPDVSDQNCDEFCFIYVLSEPLNYDGFSFDLDVYHSRTNRLIKSISSNDGPICRWNLNTNIDDKEHYGCAYIMSCSGELMMYC